MNQASEQWHMKKEINLAHVITTVALAVSAFWFFSDMNERINANSLKLEYVQQQRTEDQERVEKQLDNINKKLDRLLEQK